MSIKRRRECLENPYFGDCIHGKAGRKGCEGEMTYEHAFGRTPKGMEDIVVPCCRKHNVGVSGENKRFNEYITICNYGIELMNKISPKAVPSWEQKFKHLQSLFLKS